MTDGPIIMPHPDDPPPGSTPPKTTSPDTSATPPAEPVTDVAAILANMPSRIEADDPTEQDGFGHWALGTGGLAALLMLAQYTVGGIPLLIPAIIAFAAIYFGARGLAAARRGRASNRWMSVMGIVSAILALAAIAVYFLVIVAFVAAVLEGVSPAPS